MSTIAEIFQDAGLVGVPTSPVQIRPKSDRNYFVAFTPRSGSSWLTGLLTSTKRLGRPEEWFNPDNLPGILKALPSTDLRSYVERIRHRFQTKNGVFGFEASFFQIKQVEEIASLEELFGPDLVYVYLWRRDFVAQAVSLYKAVETRHFHSVQALDEDTRRRIESLPYDGEKIRSWCRHILQQEYGFERMFAKKRVEPLRVGYEELVADPVVSVQRIGSHVGLQDIIPNGAITGQHRRISDEMNQIWAEQFLAENRVMVRHWEIQRGKVGAW